MGLKGLNHDEKSVFLSCGKALVEGPFISKEDFPTRVGMTKETFQYFLNKWPDFDANDDDLINNCFCEIVYGFCICGNEWQNWFEVSMQEVERIYEKWRRLNDRFIDE